MKFYTLDVLRGFAALWVFTFHFPFYSAENVNPALLEFFRLGHYGVPLFAGVCALLVLRTFPVDYLAFAGLMTPVAWLLYGLDGPVTRLRDSRSRIVAWPARLVFALGTVSYSLYLLHGRLVSLGAQLVRQVVSIDSPLFPVLAIGLTTALCFVFYRFCEKPFVLRKAAPAPKKADAPVEVAAA